MEKVVNNSKILKQNDPVNTKVLHNHNKICICNVINTQYLNLGLNHL